MLHFRLEVGTFLKAGRTLRGSTLSRRSRTRVSEGILSTPNSDLKFWAGTKLSSKRIFTSKFSIDVIFKLYRHYGLPNAIRSLRK